MTPFHDDVFFEIDSARKLAAEFKARRPGGGVEPAGETEEAEIRALADEEERVNELARERAEREEKARAEARAFAAEHSALRTSLASERARKRLEAATILEELAKARAEERAAAEETLRKAGPAAAAAEPIRYSWFPARGASQTWYFTAEGERRGPVTFAELRTMAANSVLNPRLDLVWKKGMDDWKPAGHIDGLFARNAFQNEPAAKPAARPEPMASLRSEMLIEALASKNLVWPGAGRRGLWLGMLLFLLLWKRVLVFAAPHLAVQFGEVWIAKILPWAGWVPWLAITLLVLNRLVNLGMSRWWMAALAVPPLNVWVAFRCLICPPGYAYHRKMDRTGIALMVALGVLGPVAAVGVPRLPAMLTVEHLLAGARSTVEHTAKVIVSRF